jgi:hypothetical protein
MTTQRCCGIKVWDCDGHALIRQEPRAELRASDGSYAHWHPDGALPRGREAASNLR